jgi:trehalose synthase
MLRRIDDYRNFVSDKEIENIHNKASKLTNKHIVHMNSTYYGGGVSEILSTLVMLMNDLDIKTGWRLIKGNPDFFAVTKKFHNALHGEKINLSSMKKKVYVDQNMENAQYTHIGYHDLVVVHDPQPLPIINFYQKKTPWLWRCHVDMTKPNREVWNYLYSFIKKYDGMVVSANQYKQKKVKISQHVIQPSIDPLDSKNIELSSFKISKLLKKFGIDEDKPIVSQISRFDKWKDPSGVIDAYRIAKTKIDFKLVLLGDFATDDPEGQKIYDTIMSKKGADKDIIVINQTNSLLVNALQRKSAVVLQKSLKEGFGLTVSEALWKETPVIGGNVGGIPMQIRNGVEGYLVNDIDECAKALVKLLKNPRLAIKLGKAGKERVRKYFLTPRHLEQYLDLFNYYLNKKR